MGGSESNPANIVAGTGYAVGDVVNPVGILIDAATINAGSGDIIMNGQGDPGGNNNYGIYITGTAATVQTTGNITLNGIGGGNGIGDGNYNYGVYMDTAGGSIQSTNGNISVTGYGSVDGISGSNIGVYVGNGTIETTGSGNVSVTGTGGGESSYDYGVEVAAVNGIQASGSGNVTVTGYGSANGTNDNYGVYVDSGSITGAGGNVTVNGTGGTSSTIGSSNDGVLVTGSGGAISNTGNGTVSITGTGEGTTTGNYGVSIASSGTVTAANGLISITGIGSGNGTTSNYGINVAGNITSTGSGGITLTATGGNGATDLNAGAFTIGGASSTGPIAIDANSVSWSTLAINTSGTVTIDPRTASTTIGVDGGAGTLGVTSTILGDISRASAITIGSASDSGTVTIGNGNFSTATSINGGSGQIIVDANSFPTGLTLSTTGNVDIYPSTASTTIGVAGGTGSLAISSTVLSDITAGSLTIGNSADTGLLTVAANNWGTPLTLIAGSGGMTISGNQAMGANNLILDVSSTPTISGNLTGTGTLTIAPNTASTTIGVNGGSGTIAISSGILGYIPSGWTNVVIGSAVDTGAMAITGGATYSSPTTFTNGSGATTWTGNSYDSNIAFNSVGTLTIAPSTASDGIGVGTGATGTLTLTNANLGSITAGTLVFGSTSTTGNIDIEAETWNRNISFIDSGAGTITVAGNQTVGSGYNMILQSDVTPTLSGTITGSSTGTINLESSTASDTIAVDGTGSTLNFSSAFLGNLAGWGTYGFGSSADTGAMTVTANSWGADNLNLTTHSGVITLSSGSMTVGNLTISTDANPVISSTISGSGTLTIEPTTASTTMTVGGTGNTLALTGGELTNLGTGWSGMTFGSGTMTGVMTADAETWSNNVTLEDTGVITVAGATMGSHNLTILTNSAPSFNGGSNSITGSGDLTIAPITASTTMAIGGTGLTLNLTTTDMAAIESGWSLETYGAIGDTGAITVDANTFNDNTTIIGGAITASGAISHTSGDKTLTLESTGAIAESGGITGASGDPLNIIMDSNSAGGAGGISITGEINSYNGSIILGGGETNPGSISGVVLTDSGTVNTAAAGYAGGTAGNAVGVNINGVTVNAGTGNITINGQGDTTGSEYNYGVEVQGGGILEGSGEIQVSGLGGGTSADNIGVLVTGIGSEIQSTYNGGSGSSVPVYIQGTGTNSANSYGVSVGNINNGGSGGTITTVVAPLIIDGTGGIGSGGSDFGVVILGTSGNAATISSTGSGNVTVAGTGGGTGSGETGVLVDNYGSIASGTGSITVTGTASAAGTSNDYGVEITATSAAIESTGGGNVSVTGIGGGSSLGGVSTGDTGIYSSGSITTTGSGNITLSGIGSGNASYGVYLVNSANATPLLSTGSGNITVNGTGSGNSEVTYGGYAGEWDIYLSGYTSTANVSTTGTVTLDGLGTCAACGVSIGSVAAFDYYAGPQAVWDISTLTNIGFNGAGIQKTTGGNATWDISAPGSIYFATGTSVTSTSGALNLILDADTAGKGGSITLGGNITTDGGNLIAGGGSNPATGYAVGITGVTNSGTALTNIGVSIGGVTISTGSGNIVMNGEGSENGGDGISIPTGALLETTSGSITMAAQNTTGDSYNAFVLASGATIATTTGAITLSGTTENDEVTPPSNLIGLNISGDISSTGTGSDVGVITLTGVAHPDGDCCTFGIATGGTISSVDANISVSGTDTSSALYSPTLGYDIGLLFTSGTIITSTGKGNISLVGVGDINNNNGNYGIQMDSDTTVSAHNGSISMQGTGGGYGTAEYGLYIDGNIISTGTAPITLTGIGANGSASLYNDGTAATIGGGSDTGNITLNQNTATWGALSIQTTGTVTFAPRTAGTTIGVGSAASGTLDLTDELLGDIDAGKIVIGNTLAGNADINTAGTFTAPLTVVSGGNIQLDSSLSDSATGTAITLAASNGDFINNAGADALSAPDGRWLVYSYAPSDDSLGGISGFFNQYGCTFGGSCAELPAGNGMLYSLDLGGIVQSQQSVIMQSPVSQLPPVQSDGSLVDVYKDLLTPREWGLRLGDPHRWWDQMIIPGTGYLSPLTLKAMNQGVDYTLNQMVPIHAAIFGAALTIAGNTLSYNYASTLGTLTYPSYEIPKTPLFW